MGIQTFFAPWTPRARPLREKEVFHDLRCSRHADRYASVHPLFCRVLSFLKHADLAALPVGRQPLGSTGCTVIVGEGRTEDKGKASVWKATAPSSTFSTCAGEELIGYCHASTARRSPTTWPRFPELQADRRVSDPAPRLALPSLLPEDGPSPRDRHRRAPQDLSARFVIKVPVLCGNPSRGSLRPLAPPWRGSDPQRRQVLVA